MDESLDPAIYLPPVGMIGENDHGAVVTYLQGLAQEAIEGRESWPDLVTENRNIYAYGAHPSPDPGKVTVNEIQNAVIAVTDIQTKEPPSVALEPVERGEPPECYWAGPQDVAITQLGIMPQQVATWLDDFGQEQPPLPLEEAQAEAIRQQVVAQVIPEKWFVEINDQLIADFYQSVFDVLWARSRTDRRVRSNLLTTNIDGFTFWLYEFDDFAQKHLIRETSVLQVYVDPTREDIEDMNYVGVDLTLDAFEAKHLYPQIADVIDAEAQTGYPGPIDGNTQWGTAVDRTWKRGFVRLRVFWLRNQPMPYSEQEAVELGLVLQEQPNDLGIAVPSPVGESNGESGEVPAATLLAAAAQTPAPGYTLAATGQPVAPGDVNWPSYPCLRQLTQVGPYIVDDREAETWDIPILQNVNIPLPGKPFGIGEPYRLKQLQDAHSDVVDAMVKYTRFFKAPVTAMSQSMANALKEDYGDAHVDAGRTLIIPDELYQQMGGQIHSVVNPPPLPEALKELQPNLKELITSSSGHAEVLQGKAQPQVKSGKAIELLQSAASSMVGFKSQRTGDFVYRMGRMMLHSIITRLDVDDLAKIVSKYPRHILEAIHQRGQSAEWDVAVTVMSGNGAVRQQKAQQGIIFYQAGLQSKETTQEQAGIDPRQETQRQMKETQQAAMGQAPMGGEGGGQPPGQGGPPKQEKAPEA